MLRARSGLSQTMIGRAQPLRALVDLVATAGSQTTGEPAVALVSADPGVGKTRLLSELCRRLEGGPVILAAQAQPGSLGLPFDVAEALVGEPARGPDDEAGAVVTRVARAVLDRIGDRAGIVVVEDLHWADAGSVAVLSRLVAIGRPDLVVVLSYRPDEITHRLPGGELLARLERTRHALRLHLEPLRRHEIAAFLASVYERPMASSVVDTLLARTGGNPFFLEELLYAAGSVDPDRLADQPLPWSLADLVGHQLEGLDGDERSVVEASAVLGNRAPFDVLQAVTGHDEADLVRLLRALVQRGLLGEDGDDDFSFRHALVRDAVLHQMLSRERRRLHTCALGALRAQCCADVADLARHASGAGLWDELVALARDGVPYYLARGSSHQALRLATDALAEAPDDIDLLAGAARAAWLLGFGAEALTHAHRWQAVARAAPSIEQEAAAGRLLARLYHEQSDDRLWPHVAQLEALTARLPDGVERARLLAALAQAEMLADHGDAAVRWGEAAIEAAERAGAKDVLAQAKVETGSALVDDADRFEYGEQILRDGVAEAEALGDWVLVARGLNNLISYQPYGDPGTLALVARVEAAGERAGFDTNLLRACERLVEYAVAVADRDLALAELDRLDEAERIAGRPASASAVLRALLEGEAGRPEAAVAVVGSPAHRYEDTHWAEWDLPVIAALAGDPGPALDALAAAAADPPLGRLRRFPTVLHEHTWWALYAGADSAALAAAVAPLLATEHPLVAVAVRGVRAELAFANGRHDEVIALLHERYGAEGDGSPDRRHAARLRVVLARALAATGRRADALAVARAAAVDLERWPGFRFDEVERLVTRLSSAAGDGTLTGRELEVAELVAEGLTNAELARRLYIAPKTAAVHVSNILTKLGVANRTELAAWYVRHTAADD